MNNILLRFFCSLATGAVLLLGPVANAAITLDDKVPFSPRQKMGTLPNGLTYYIQRNLKPAKKVELRLVIKAGSILEDDDQQGLAHFTEHMAFNGTTHFKRNELVSFLQSQGIKLGADLNAFTSFDQTTYVLPVPTNDKAILERAFTVLEDWAAGLNMDPVDIDMERGVILEESRLRKGAGERMNRQILPKTFAGSKYAERLPIGRDDTIRHFKYESLKRFYADWYRPDLMAVIVVGDIDPAEAERLVRLHFEALKNPASERPRLYVPVPERTLSEALTVTDAEATSNLVAITYSRQPEHLTGSFADYRRALIAQLFNNMLGQRLQELAQSASPPFVSAGSTLRPLVVGYREFASSAVVGRAGPETALKALVQENERVAQFGFTAAELERARKTILRGLEYNFNERENIGSSSITNRYIQHFLTGGGGWDLEYEFEFAKVMLPTITLDELTVLAKQVVTGNGNKLVLYQGAGTGDYVPLSAERLLGTVSAASGELLAAYAEKKVAASLMDNPPAAGNIVSEKTNANLGATELLLDNGVKVILKPTKFQHDQVLMSATRDGGKSLFAETDFYNMQMASQLMAGMGVKDYSPTELRKILNGKTVSISPTLNELGEGISGQAGSADLEAMLQLTYLHFTQPRTDEALLQTNIGKLRDSVKNLLANPENAFTDAQLKNLYNDHPRRPHVLRPTDLDKIQLERMESLYRQRFSSARGFTFIIVGSFELEQIKPLVASYLGGLPGAEIATTYKDVMPRMARGVIRKVEHGGSENKSIIALNFTGDTAYSADANMKLHALVDVVNLKLTERLRQEMGAVYSPRVAGQMSKRPYGHYSVSITLSCDPDNVDRLIAATLEELKKIRESGAEATDLNKVKENWLKNQRESFKSNGYWLRNLQIAVELQEDPSFILNYPARVKAIEPEDLKGAARTYFNLDNYLQVVLYPVEKVALQ
jgi:zinc protease